MSTIKIVVLASLAAPVATCVCAQGAVVGFHESFAQDAANWRGASSATTLGWSSLGGPGDAAYVTSIYNLVNTQAGGIPATIIRAATSAGSSGGAYQGKLGDRRRHGSFVLVPPRPLTIDFALPSYCIAAELSRRQCLRWCLDPSQHVDARRV